MNTLNRALLFLHFVGLALGFSVSFANIEMSGLVARAAPSEKPVLGRFPPMMSRVGTIGLALLWVTGGSLVYTKWGGFASMPWQFDVKLAAVVLLTITTRYIHRIEPLLQTGGPAVMARVQAFGKLATSLALIALLFAVLTFD